MPNLFRLSYCLDIDLDRLRVHFHYAPVRGFGSARRAQIDHLSHIGTLALRIRLELLRFWDVEALSRRTNQQIASKQHSIDEISNQESRQIDDSRIIKESSKSCMLETEPENVHDNHKFNS